MRNEGPQTLQLSCEATRPSVQSWNPTASLDIALPLNRHCETLREQAGARVCHPALWSRHENTQSQPFERGCVPDLQPPREGGAPGTAGTFTGKTSCPKPSRRSTSWMYSSSASAGRIPLTREQWGVQFREGWMATPHREDWERGSGRGRRTRGGWRGEGIWDH